MLNKTLGVNILTEAKSAVPPFYDLPRYSPAFLEAMDRRPAETHPSQNVLSVLEAMTILRDGCILAEETDPSYMYECWFLSRSGRVVRFCGHGAGSLHLVSADFAESMLANFLSDDQMDQLRSHGVITTELV